MNNNDSTQRIDIEKYKKLVEREIASHGVVAKVEDIAKVTVYTINTKEATLEIDIGKRWVGYDFTISAKIFGKRLGRAPDTDLYPLDGDPTDVKATEQIFSETLACLKGLLEGRVYVGRLNNKPTLIVPTSDTHYAMLQKHWFSMTTKSITQQELDKLAELRPVQ